MKKVIYILTLSVLVVSCKPTTNQQKQTPSNTPTQSSTPPPSGTTLKSEQFFGEWRNISMKITTAYKTANSAVEDYKEENWEKDLKIKPIRTYYKPDGTYLSEYRGLDNVVFSTTSGSWQIKQDSVYLNQTQPEVRNAAYHVKFHDENTATFTAMLDWTDNGKKDDLYVGKQQRMVE